MTRVEGQPPLKAVRTFRTTTAALWLVADWRQAAGGTHVARERTGVYGRPVSNRRAGLVTLVVVKAPPITAVPGRHTEVTAAAWSAARLRHGLWRGRGSPAKPPRQRRELTRHRTTRVPDRARVLHRVHAVWEEATSTLASVVTASRGVSARARLEALMAGHREVAARAELARGRRRTKRAPREAALPGDFTPHPRCLRTEDFSQYG
jgi:hypothetical protein